MISRNQRMPTVASEMTDEVGPDVAADLERSKEQLLNFGRY